MLRAQGIPAPSQAGYPAVDIVIWNAMMAPVGTPSEVTTKLGTEILEIRKLPDVQQGFANQGAVMNPGDAARLASFLKTELATFAKVVKESGARID